MDTAVREAIAGQPLGVEIVARDALGAPITKYTGAVNLSATVRGSSPGVLISEWTYAPEPTVELVNVSPDLVDLAGWTIYAYTQSGTPGLPYGAFSIPAPAVCPPGGIVIIRSRGSAPGRYPEFTSGQLPFLPPFTSRMAVVLIDPRGRVADALPAGAPGFISTITEPARIPESVWSGDPPVLQGFGGSTSVQRVGSRNHGSAIDWITGPSSIGTPHAGLQLPFVPAEEALPISPTVVELGNGRWQGEITIAAAAPGVILRADDGTGHTGASASVQVHPLPPLSLIVPAYVDESQAGPTNGIVSIPAPLATDLVIALESSDPSEIEVPASVTVIAGTTQTLFQFLHHDDDLLDGTQMVAVTARGPGLSEAVAMVASQDDEPGVLHLSLPTFVRKDELRLPFQAEVSTTRPVDKQVRIELHTDRPDLLRIPTHVDLMPGDVRAPFQIRANGVYTLSGDQEATITARVTHWTPATGTLRVQDPYLRALSLSQSADIIEGAGPTDFATIQLPARFSSDLLVRLTADPPGVLQMASSVIVPAGESRAVIKAAMLNDALTNGTRLVTVSAQADGFNPASTQVRAIDNDPTHLVVELSGSVLVPGESIEITITAHNSSDDFIPTFHGPFILRATRDDGTPVGSGIPLETHGFLSNGKWRGRFTPTSEVPGLILLAALTRPDGVIGRSPPINVANVRVVSIDAGHLIVDPHRGRLLASVQTPTENLPYGIAAIDPLTGAVTNLVTADERTGHLALSDDGAYLYAAAAESSMLFRFRLDTAAEDLRWDINAGLQFRPEIPFLPPYLPYSVHAMPGQPRSVLVLFGGPWGAAIFDDDEMRPQILIAPGILPDPASEPAPDDSSRLFLFNGSLLTHARIVPSGVSLERSFPGPRNPPGPPAESVPLQVALADRLAYQSDGWIIDPEHFEVRAVAPAAGAVIRDTAAGRLHYLRWTSAQREVVSVDTSTLQPVARLTLPGSSTGVTFDFIRWGDDGLAFRTWEGEVHIIRSQHLVPQPAATDLGISATAPTGPLLVGDPIKVTITVTNTGPAAAPNVVVEDVLPRDTDILETSLQPDQWSHTNGIAHFRLGQITAGGQVRFEITVRARTPIESSHRIRVLGGAINTANDLIELAQSTILGPALPPITPLWADGSALAHDPTRNRLYISGVEPASGQSRLLVLDLNRGVFEAPIAVPESMRKLAVTSDGQYLYGSVLPGNRDPNDYSFGTRIDRLRLPDGTMDTQFNVVDNLNQEHTVFDLLTIPGRPLDLLIARAGPQNDVALYTDGRQSARSPVDLRVFHLANIPGSADEILAYSFDPPARLIRLGVQGSSLPVVASSFEALQAFSSGIWVAGGRVYDTWGTAADVQSLSRTGLVNGGSFAAADHDEDIIIFLRVENSRWILYAYRASTSEPLWSHGGLEPFHEPLAFVSCGQGLFALLSNDGRLFLIQSRLLPGMPVADVAVVSDLVRVQDAPGGAAWFDLRLDVTNRGPNATGAIVFTNLPPANSTILESSVPYEWIGLEAGEPGGAEVPPLAVRLVLPDGLDPHTSVRVSLRLQSLASGTATNEIAVSAEAHDPDLANNIDRARAFQPLDVEGGRVLDGFTALDLAFDRTRNVLYVSSPGPSPRENRLLRIDPASGRVLQPLDVGPQPTLLALSHDDQFLYVAVAGAEAIERVNLTTGAVDLRWELDELLAVESMVVSPTDPRLLAVALQRSGGGSPRHAGVVLYRDGVALPGRSQIPTWANTLAFVPDGSVLYGYDNETSAYAVHRFEVTANGITRTDSVPGLIDGYDHRIAQADGLLFSTSGVIIDPARPEVIGTFPIDPPQHPERTHAMKIDTRSKTAFFTTGTGGSVRLLQFQTPDQTPLGSVPLPVTEAATAIDTWGNDGVAVALGAGGLFLTQVPFATPASDPELRLEISTNHTQVGDTVSYTITVTNRGNARASGVVVTVNTPPNMGSTGVMSATAGLIYFGFPGITWLIDSIAPHSSASASFEMLIVAPGVIFALGELTSESADSNPANNKVSLYGSALDDPNPFHLPAADAVYHPNTEVVFVSLEPPHEVILPLDLRARLLRDPIRIPGGAGAMVLAADQRQIRVALRDGGFLTLDPTVSPPALSAVTQVGLDTSGMPMPVVAIATLPGRPEITAVAARASTDPAQFQIAVFDGAVSRPDHAVITDAAAITSLAFEADGQSLHVGTDTGYRRHSVSPQGVAAVPMAPPRADLTGRFVLANGRLYFEAGPVITSAPETPGSIPVAGFLPFPGVLTASPTTDQLFVITGTEQAEAIKAFKASTLIEQWERSFAPFGAAGTQLLATRTNEVLARFTEARALIVSAEGSTTDPAADLRISVVTPSGWTGVGATFSYTVRVENHGPWTAHGVRLLHSRPHGVEWIAIEPSQGTNEATGQNLIWDLGSLSSDRTAQITFQSRALIPGRHPATASIESDTPDPDPTNDTFTWDLRVEPAPAISIADVTHLITSDQASFFDVPVLLSSRAALEIAAGIAVTNGTAVSGADFQLSRPTLTISPGRTNGSVRINLPPQPQPVGERTFTLGLTNVVNARLLRDHAVIRLRDARVPTVTVSGGSQAEGGEGASASIPFTVLLSSPFPEPVRVEYQTVNATARAGIDYRPAHGTLVFPPGTTNLTLSVDVFGNDRPEGDRRFQIVLGSVSNGRLGIAGAEGLIIDDDPVDTAVIHYLVVEEGAVRIGYIVPPGFTAVVEACSEWTTSAWISVSEPQPGDGTMTEFVDTPDSALPLRFYRIRVIP